MAYAIRSFGNEANNNLLIKFNPIVQQTYSGTALNLQTQQKILQEEYKVCDIYLELVKAVTEKTFNLCIIWILYILKQWKKQKKY